ncbi:MAG: hypothetical protein ACOYL5_09610 [Phototrophicaceae bacterium]
MATPNKLKKLEETHGDLHLYIPSLVNQLGSQRAAAASLGISEATLSTYLTNLGYRSVTVYIQDGQKVVVTPIKENI